MQAWMLEMEMPITFYVCFPFCKTSDMEAVRVKDTITIYMSQLHNLSHRWYVYKLTGE